MRAGIASMPMRYAVRVRFAVPPEVVHALVGNWATIEPVEGGCRMTMNTETLDWPLMTLAGVDADFTIEEPAELRDLAVAAGRRLSAPPTSR